MVSISDRPFMANIVEKVGFKRARRNLQRLGELIDFGYGGRLQRRDLLVAIPWLSDR